jgi:hypothetical protein
MRKNKWSQGEGGVFIFLLEVSIMFLSTKEVEQRRAFLTSLLEKGDSVVDILDKASFPQLKTLYKVLSYVVLGLKESPSEVKKYFEDCPERETLLLHLASVAEAEHFMNTCSFHQLQDFLISAHSSLGPALSVYFVAEESSE